MNCKFVNGFGFTVADLVKVFRVFFLRFYSKYCKNCSSSLYSFLFNHCNVMKRVATLHAIVVKFCRLQMTVFKLFAQYFLKRC